jgi:Fe-S cluster assembly ATP-binding protein
MLEVRNLHVSIEETTILKGIDLAIAAGEVHAIMGPNGSGKSTLAHALAGAEAYTVTEGEAVFRGKDLLSLEPEERAGEGLFLSFQYPVEIPGVSNRYFIRTALNSVRKYRGEEEIGAMEFIKLLGVKAELMQVDPELLTRSVNEGFSGGEKKRNEILQMLVLDPKLAILDETDSGLDIDALKIVAEGINHQRRADNAILLVTHYQRLLNYVEPDRVHVLSGGRIIRSGGKELAELLEREGYGWIESASGQQVGS